MPEHTRIIEIRVREWRERRGYSILELSRLAQVNRANLYQIEAGETGAINLELLQRLAHALAIKPSQLISP